MIESNRQSSAYAVALPTVRKRGRPRKLVDPIGCAHQLTLSAPASCRELMSDGAEAHSREAEYWPTNPASAMNGDFPLFPAKTGSATSLFIVPKKRGRPRKISLLDNNAEGGTKADSGAQNPQAEQSSVFQMSSVDDLLITPVKRGRGRPRKNPNALTVRFADLVSAEANEQNSLWDDKYPPSDEVPDTPETAELRKRSDRLLSHWPVVVGDLERSVGNLDQDTVSFLEDLLARSSDGNSVLRHCVVCHRLYDPMSQADDSCSVDHVFGKPVLSQVEKVRVYRKSVYVWKITCGRCKHAVEVNSTSATISPRPPRGHCYQGMHACSIVPINRSISAGSCAKWMEYRHCGTCCPPASN